MQDTSFILLTVGGLAFLLAGFVKGTIGMGLPTVAIGVLGMVMAPAQAAALLVIPTIVTNLWQLVAGTNLRPLLRRLWPLLVMSALVTFLGAGLMAKSGELAPLALGIGLIVYAGVGLAKVEFSVPASAEPWLSPLVGAITGVITAATGLMALPAVAYFQAIGLDKDDMIQALGLSFSVSILALGSGLARAGIFQGSVITGSLLALVPACVGMLAGQWVRARIRPEIFRFCLYLGLLALGAELLLRAFR
jgi:uncharacterized protein